nr:hypothetical protein BCU18_17770 [Vibrio lentus]
MMAHLELTKPIYYAIGYAFLMADDDEGFELGICLIPRELIEAKKIFPVLIRADRISYTLQDTAVQNGWYTRFQSHNTLLS